MRVIVKFNVFYHGRSNDEVYRAQVVIRYSGTVEITILAIIIFLIKNTSRCYCYSHSDSDVDTLTFSSVRSP